MHEKMKSVIKCITRNFLASDIKGTGKNHQLDSQNFCRCRKLH